MSNNSNDHELINNKINYDVISAICLIIAGKPASCLPAYPYNILVHIYNIIIHSILPFYYNLSIYKS